MELNDLQQTRVQKLAQLRAAGQEPFPARVQRSYRSIDETYLRSAGRWCYALRAIAADSQVIDVSVNPARDTAAATTFLTRAVECTAVPPAVATTDRAASYPPALAAVLPAVVYIKDKLVQQGSSATISISKGGRARCAASRNCHVPRSSARDTAAYAICMPGSTSVDFRGALPPLTRDPKDDYLLAYAVVEQADYVVTGDEDLLAVAKVGSLTIITPQDFFQLI